MRFSHATTKTRRARVVSQHSTSVSSLPPPPPSNEPHSTTTQTSSNQAPTTTTALHRQQQQQQRHQVRSLSVPDDLPGLVADIDAVLRSQEETFLPPRLPRASSLANVSTFYSPPDEDEENAQDWLWLDDDNSRETQRSWSLSVTLANTHQGSRQPRPDGSSGHSLEPQDWVADEGLHDEDHDFSLWKRSSSVPMDHARDNSRIVPSPMVHHYPSVSLTNTAASSSLAPPPPLLLAWNQVARGDPSSSSSITTMFRTARSASNHLPDGDEMAVARACLDELSFMVSEERQCAANNSAATSSNDAAVSKINNGAAAAVGGLCQASPSSVFDLYTIGPSLSGPSPTRPPASIWMSGGKDDDDVCHHAHDHPVQHGCNSKCHQFPLPCVHRHHRFHHCGGRACPEDEHAALLFQKHLNRANSLPPTRTTAFAAASTTSSSAASVASPSSSSLMIGDTQSSPCASLRNPQLPRKPSLKRISSLQSSENHSGIPNSSSSNNNNSSSSTNLKRNVSFSKLEIREYNIELSDHPGCSFGPPIQLGWKVCDETTMSVEDYEQMRLHQHRPRRSGTDLTLSYNVRRYLLLKRAGYSKAELKQAMKEVNRIKRERLVTDLLLPASFLDETLEDWMHKVKQFFQVS